MKVMKTMKVKQVLKAEVAMKVVKKKKTLAVGRFAKSVAAPKRKEELDKNAGKQENPAKKIKVKPQDEKTLAAERKIALTAMKLADLEELHKTNAIEAEAVKVFVSRTKEEFTAEGLPDLKELCGKKELKVGGTKGDLVQRLLDHAKEDLKAKMVQSLLAFEANTRKEAREKEAKAREEARLHAIKVREVVSGLKKEVATKTNDELKEILTGYGLKAGKSKDEKVERVVERQREDGEVEKVLVARARDERKQQLLSTSTASLIEMCTKEVLEDRLVKEIIVDRLLLSEAKSAGFAKLILAQK